MAESTGQQLFVKNSFSNEDSQSLRLQFQDRITGIEQEMKKIHGALHDFLGTVHTDFNSLLGKINIMRENMQQLREESKKSNDKLRAS